MPHGTLTAPWWTPWPGTGPGHNLLGDLTGLTVLELGCGNGDNAAAFARGGAEVTAIDHNPAKVTQARRRWYGFDRLRFEHAEAADHLARLAVPVDVVCSIFGALSFGPAEPLLDQIAAHLWPGGRLAIAARTPADRPAPGGTASAWATHAQSPDTWQHLLAERGLDIIRSQVLDHPTDTTTAPCIVLVAVR